ncbi:PTS sugar transporter subunit IIABC [Mycoplasmopsis bovirhinis]|uniref:PTS glucose transporter subunit IIA n=1 Tax=Mycoplasmopsis bovirhinis TaxID=29553 RepID=UPI000BB9D788|nr:PTS glucose transporter subunit IIA [Mycoplasmopsis bovirhinis]ATO31044.1 PTS sugar transporter subunit IIABC [Mycoplasmopsis bovirhinis]BBA22100.1 PTS sugar transporter subunit IIABC [Mycoplasmopsis bovirhinis]
MRILNNLFKKKQQTIQQQIYPVFAGKIKLLDKVSKQTYDYSNLGPGFVIEFSSSSQTIIIKSPVSGVLDLVFPSFNSYVIKTSDGIKVLVSLGIDTLKCPEAFEPLIEEGREVREGDALVKMDLNKLRALNLITDAIIVLLPESNVVKVEYDDFIEGSIVDLKQAILTVYK